MDLDSSGLGMEKDGVILSIVKKRGKKKNTNL